MPAQFFETKNTHHAPRYKITAENPNKLKIYCPHCVKTIRHPGRTPVRRVSRNLYGDLREENWRCFKCEADLSREAKAQAENWKRKFGEREPIGIDEIRWSQLNRDIGKLETISIRRAISRRRR
jgi:transposase-like protein